MRIAVAVTGMAIARQFEQCSCLAIYTVTNGIITSSQSIPNPGPPYTMFAVNLAELGVDTLIVDTIMDDTEEMFSSQGVEVMRGLAGEAKTAVDHYLTQTFIDCDCAD